MRKFSLSCLVECEAPRINTWLSIALDHKVQVLKLRFSNPILYTLPPSLFTSELLIKLKVGMFEYLQLPSHISFPRLKKLTLKHITFVDDHSKNLLFSGCHVLERLTLDECDWGNLHFVFISINTLKTLLIFESSEDNNNCCVVINGVQKMRIIIEHIYFAIFSFPLQSWLPRGSRKSFFFFFGA